MCQFDIHITPHSFDYSIYGSNTYIFIILENTTSEVKESGSYHAYEDMSQHGSYRQRVLTREDSQGKHKWFC